MKIEMIRSEDPRDEPLIEGEELHRVLKVSEAYDTWIKKTLDIENYTRFEPNCDYWFSKHYDKEGRVINECCYILGLQCAKDIALAQETHLGLAVFRELSKSEKRELSFVMGRIQAIPTNVDF